MVAKAGADVVSRVLLAVVVVLILRNRGASELGAWSQVLVLMTLLAPVAALGLGNAVVPFFSPARWDPPTRRRALELVAVASVCAVAAGLILALAASPVNALILDWPDGTGLFRAGGALLTSSALLWIGLLLLQARRHFAGYVIVQLFESISTLIAALVLLPGRSVLSLIVAVGVIRSIAAVAAITVAITAPGSSEGMAPPSTSRMARFGLGIVAADLGAWMVQLSDRLIYGHYGSAEGLGAYAAVYTAAGLIAITGAAVFLPAYPRLAQAWADEGADGAARAMRGFHGLLALSLPPLAAFLVVVVRPVLELIGQGDVDPGGGVVACVVLAIGLNQWNGLSHLMLVIAEGGRSIFRAWAAAGAISIIAGFLTIPRLGLLGAAVSTVIGYAVADALLAAQVQRLVDLRKAYDWGTSARASIATAVALAPLLMLIGPLGDSVMGLAVAGAAYWLTFGVAVTVVRGLPETLAARV